MSDAVQLERIAKRPHHRFLANKVREKLRAVFAGEDLIGRLGIGRGHFFFSEHGEGGVIALGFFGGAGLVSHCEFINGRDSGGSAMARTRFCSLCLWAQRP